MRCSSCESLNLEGATTCYNCGARLIPAASQYAPPVASLDEPKRGFRAIWLLWGCGGLVILLVLTLASCFLFVKGAMKVGDKEFGPACAQYLEHFEAREFSAAWALMGDEAKEAIPEAKHNAIMAGIQSKLGNVKSMSTQFVQTGFDQKGKWGKIVYQAEFERGKGTIRFELRKQAVDYKVVGVFFESPVLTEYFNQVLSRNP
jgi:hypothetical protein